jgi:hypothetical protein
MTDYNYLSNGNPIGTILGQSSTKLVGFWGISGADQPAALTTKVSTITYTTATTPTSIMVVSATATTSSAGFVTTAEFGGVCNAVKNAQIRIKELETGLVELGIIAGGTAVVTCTAAPYDIVGYGNDEGSMLGRATTSLVGFFGITPCDQPAALTTITNHPQLITTATTDTTGMTTTIAVGVSNSAGYGIGVDETTNPAHSFLGMIANVQTRLDEIQTNLAQVGLIAGGTAVTSADGTYTYLDKGNDDGTILGRDADALIGFWAATPCNQAAALTTARTTITFVSAVEATYVIASMAVSLSSGFKFVTVTAGNTLILAVQNAQIRLGEIEAALNECGLQAN